MSLKYFSRVKNSFFIGLFSACVGYFGAAQALTVTSGCLDSSYCTLDELFSGGSIQIDNVLFDSFSAASPASLNGASSIVVSGVGGGTDLGLQYRDLGSNWEATAFRSRSSINRGLRYTVSVSGGSQLIGSTLNMVNGNGGLFSVNAPISVGNGNVITRFGSASIGIRGTLFGGNSSSSFDISNFSPLNTTVFAPTSFLNSSLNINLFASSQLNAASADLDIFQQRFNLDNVAPVPVPAAVWLFGSALVFLTGFRSRRSKV